MAAAVHRNMALPLHIVHEHVLIILVGVVIFCVQFFFDSDVFQSKHYPRDLQEKQRFQMLIYQVCMCISPKGRICFFLSSQIMRLIGSCRDIPAFCFDNLIDPIIAAWNIFYSCILNTAFRNFHQYWHIVFYIHISDRGIDKKMNNNTSCQYIGCIGGHVTLSWRCVKVTSLQHDIQRQFSVWRTSAYRDMTFFNGNFYAKIKWWRWKGMQEKESIMVAWCR